MRAPPRRSVLFAGGACALAAAVALFVIPFPHSFYLREAGVADLNPVCVGVEPWAGTSLTFFWVAPSAVDFVVVSCEDHSVVYSVHGVHGSGSFVARGGEYEFGATCAEGPCVAANVTGYVVGPMLPL